MVAARALAACGDDKGLRALARQVKAAPDRLSPRLAPEFALVLFPSRMSVPDLIDLIDRSQPARQFEVEGFSRHLPTLFAAAQPRPAQKEFAFRIAELCLAESNDEDDSIASRHRELSKGVSKLAVTELSTRQEGSIEPGLIRLLRAVERAQSDSDDEEELSTIRARLKRDKALNRDLMWTNARQEVNGVPRAKLPIREFQVGPHSGRMLWSTDLSDLEWLTDDCPHLPAENERRVAFEAIYKALHWANLLPSRADFLDELAHGCAALQEDLAGYRTPPPPNPYDAELEASRRRRAVQTSADKASPD
jgi:hypothetical protein